MSKPENPSLTYQEVASLYAADMAAIEKAIFDRLKSRNELLEKIATYIASSGGKRLRPLLVVICAKLNGYSGSDHIALGNVVEYLHAATLLHDDVLDNARVRRGVPSANEKWGNHFAVLGGDFLYTTAFDILLRSFPREIIQVLCRCSLDMIEGEVLQQQWRNRIDIPEKIYFEIISLKTASLISACCHTGALLGGASPSQAENLALFGRELGTAFQVIDDTLDYTADPARLGKALGGDLRQGTVTLPLIYLLQENDLSGEAVVLAKEIERGEISDATLESITGLIEKRGSARKAMQKAAALAETSKAALQPLTGSRLHAALMAAADFIINRTH